MIRKIVSLILASIMPLGLVGCFDKVELEERAIVLAIGIDKYTEEEDTNIEKNGEEKRFIVSLAMPDVSEEEKEGKSEKNQSEAMQDSSGKSKNEAIKLGEGASVASVIQLIDTYMSKKLYFGHTKAVVLGNEILKDEDMLKEVIDSLERNNEISRKVVILGTSKNAKDILETVPKDEKMLGIYINDFYKNGKRSSALTYNIDLEDMIQDMLAREDAVLPDIEIVDDDVRLFGTVALKQGKYAGRLDSAESRGLLWVVDKKSLGEIDAPFEDGYISTTIYKKKVKRKIEEKDGKIKVRFDINAEGNISEYSLGKSIVMNSDEYKKVEEALALEVRKNIELAINKMKELGADLFGLKELIRREKYDLYKKYNLENVNIYEIVDIEVLVNVRIKGGGSVK